MPTSSRDGDELTRLPAAELAARLAARYWDLDDPRRAADLEGLLADEQVRVVIHPESVRRFSY